jgi:hypothetical protein
MTTMSRNRAIQLALSVTIAVAASTLTPRHGHAQTYGDAPWCAMLQPTNGEVVRDCRYRSAEECAPNVSGATRGFCGLNPYFTGVAAPARPAVRTTHRRHRTQG